MFTCAAFGAMALSLSACGAGTSSTASAAAPAAAAATPDASLSPAPDATPGPTAAGAAYLVFPSKVPADNWKITDAARKDDPATVDDLDEIPGLQWSAEYQDGTVADDDSAPYVDVSGFNANFADVVNDAGGDPADKAQKTSGDINGHQAIWGTLSGQDAGDTDTFVVFEVAPGQAVELEGANLSVDDLKKYAGMLTPASEQDWVQVHAGAPNDDSD